MVAWLRGVKLLLLLLLGWMLAVGGGIRLNEAEFSSQDMLTRHMLTIHILKTYADKTNEKGDIFIDFSLKQITLHSIACNIKS